MDKKRVEKIVEILAGVFPDKPALVFSSPYELLVAVILSAQCTDERVNKVTAKLFEKYNTPREMVKLSERELEKYIFSCGLYKTKAQHILSASRDIIEKHGGQVPENPNELRSLAGVGRKTANVVLAVAFNKPVIAVDTHVFRVSNRIGLVTAKDVYKTEVGLTEILDEKDRARTHHYLIYLGRSFCKSINPDCLNCPVREYCEKKIIKRKTR